MAVGRRYAIKRAIAFARWTRCFAFLVALLVPLAAGIASAVKLLEAKVTVGAVPVLQDAGGTVRLEHPQLSASGGHEVFFVPEPGVLWQLGSGVVLLVLLSTRRRSAASRPLSRPEAAPPCPTAPTSLPRRNAMESRSKFRGWSVQGAGLVFMLLALAAGPAVAQVPQDMTFSGRFVDDEGAPLVGPALVYLAIVDALTGGTTLYIEEHSVTLDAQGNFSVLLGTGADIGGPFPPFGAALFSDVERYVQVLLTYSGPPSLFFQALSPRVPLSSVPWALVAEQANKIVPDPNAPRFEDCGDGTVADHQTGLQWEKKTGTRGGDEDLSDPHNVNNNYSWSRTGGGGGTDPDGTVFTDFLAKLNDPIFGAAATQSDVTGCFAGHCDWRLPNIVELQTILQWCGGCAYIDPIFGPTMTWNYSSASSYSGDPYWAWFADFGDGFVAYTLKTGGQRVRAVRTGFCN
jgi:hypothetical protein